jgi:integrase
MKFTDISIRRLPLSDSGQKTYFDETLGGFGIRIGTKTKSWIVKYGKTRRIRTLGHYGEDGISLSNARQEAKRFLLTQSTTRHVSGYSEAVQSFIDSSERRNRPNTVREYKRFLTAFKSDKRVDDISRRELQVHLSQYERTPSNYAHALVAFKVFFNWAIRNEFTDKHPLAGERPPTIPPRERVLLPEEIQQVWAYDFAPFSTILKLCLLTGQRRTEIASIIPEWIKDGVLTIPSEITKNKRRHTIPVSEQVQEFCSQAPFGKKGAFNGWSRAKMMIDKVVDIPHWTIHDLRRTFSTIHAKIGTPIHITERLLNHASGSTGGIVGIYNKYQYMDEMREAQEKYETVLTNIVTS